MNQGKSHYTTRFWQPAEVPLLQSTHLVPTLRHERREPELDFKNYCFFGGGGGGSILSSSRYWYTSIGQYWTILAFQYCELLDDTHIPKNVDVTALGNCDSPEMVEYSLILGSSSIWDPKSTFSNFGYWIWLGVFRTVQRPLLHCFIKSNMLHCFIKPNSQKSAPLHRFFGVTAGLVIVCCVLWSRCGVSQLWRIWSCTQVGYQTWSTTALMKSCDKKIPLH